MSPDFRGKMLAEDVHLEAYAWYLRPREGV